MSYVPMTTRGNEESDHGCFAVVGDLVEMINPMGERTKLVGVVQEEFTQPSIRGPRRFLNVLIGWNDGPRLERVKDSFVRIISRC